MDSEIRSYITEYVTNIEADLLMLPSNTKIEAVINTLFDAYKVGAKVIAFGNGGSGDLAAHLIQDLAKHTIVGKDKSKSVVTRRFKALCLNESVSTMTTWANDAGYEYVFSEQLKNWVEPGDVVIGITGSGNTPNVLRAFEVANQVGATTIALTGGGKAKDLASIAVVIENEVNYAVEDLLSCVIHIVCDIVRNKIQGNSVWA